jgi:hypothetical protein
MIAAAEKGRIEECTAIRAKLGDEGVGTRILIGPLSTPAPAIVRLEGTWSGGEVGGPRLPGHISCPARIQRYSSTAIVTVIASTAEEGGVNEVGGGVREAVNGFGERIERIGA